MWPFVKLAVAGCHQEQKLPPAHHAGHPTQARCAPAAGDLPWASFPSPVRNIVLNDRAYILHHQQETLQIPAANNHFNIVMVRC